MKSLVVALVLLGTGGCRLTIKQLPTKGVSCDWQNNPNYIYPIDNWSCFVGDEAKGTVRQPSYTKTLWDAYYMGDYCGSGEYRTLEAGKKCVERIVEECWKI